MSTDVYVVTCRLRCSGFTLTLRDSPSRSPLDGDITVELTREMLGEGFDAAAKTNINTCTKSAIV